MQCPVNEWWFSVFTCVSVPEFCEIMVLVIEEWIDSSLVWSVKMVQLGEHTLTYRLQISNNVVMLFTIG